MSKVFVISDTWFNRPLEDDQHVNVVDNNDSIIAGWNDVVKKGDTVYVLGGFGIADLYHIVARLNGKIHFLDNYFVSDEKEFMRDLKDSIEKSNDPILVDRITFEPNQILVLNDLDCVLSYFPLEEWVGKDTGTFCYHGMNEVLDIEHHKISCKSSKWNHTPVNIKEIQDNIQTFQDRV